jgi:transposase
VNVSNPRIWGQAALACSNQRNGSPERQQGIRNIERLLGLLETAGDRRLPALAAEMLGILAAQLRCVAEQVKGVEVKLLAWHRADETSRRLQSVPSL